MKRYSSFNIVIVLIAALLCSCASKKAIVAGKVNTENVTSDANSLNVRKLSFVQRVSDNAVYSKDITAKIDFTIQAGDKDISVGGSLHMKKDDVIRIQLTPLGLVEVGRIEFTKDYVLVIDRMNKEYIKADYNQIDFLRDNGLNFYSLQALFWNQLFLPGTDKVGEAQLKKYDVDINEVGNDIPVSLVQPNMKFTWTANRLSGRISSAEVVYANKANGNSKLSWIYSAFKPLGAKMFPTDQTMKFISSAVGGGKEMKVNIMMNNMNTDSNWETRTNVSDRYKKVSVQDVLNKIMAL
jgi:hypothetical protein